MIPGIEAMRVMKQRTSMYCTLTLSMMRALIVAVIVVNMVRYMAVDEATAECMSNWIKTGKKIAPVLIPQVAARNAPTRPIMIILMTSQVWKV